MCFETDNDNNYFLIKIILSLKNKILIHITHYKSRYLPVYKIFSQILLCELN